MNPVTHAEISWLIANIPAKSWRRDRFLIFLSGTIPDIDAIGLFFNEDLYAGYHHIIAHNILFGLILTVAAFLTTKSILTSFLAFLSFHVHIFLDLMGSGPAWPVAYLWPFTNAELYFPCQWELRSWQNLAITVVATSLCLITAVKRGRTPLEFVSLKADGKVVEAIRWRYEKILRALKGKAQGH